MKSQKYYHLQNPILFLAVYQVKNKIHRNQKYQTFPICVDKN